MADDTSRGHGPIRGILWALLLVSPLWVALGWVVLR